VGTGFSLSEVFRIAEDIERNGGAFYRRAAEAAKEGPVKVLFVALSQQEQEHEALFASWRQELCGRADAHWVDPSGEAEAYLQAIADCHVFGKGPDISAAAAEVDSPGKILALAIGFERDTLAYFAALKEQVGPTHRDKLDLLIREELGHIKQLTEALEGLDTD